METKKKAIAGILIATIVLAGIAIAFSGDLRRGIGYASLSFAIALTAIAFFYALTSKKRTMERAEVSEEEMIEGVIRILKEARRIRDEIKRRGENLTLEDDITLAQIMWGINEMRVSISSGMSDLKSLILFGIGIMVALNIAIISMI